MVGEINIEAIFDNIKENAKNKTDFAPNTDLDKIKANHNKHMVTLSNLYEFWTHKTILLIIAILLGIGFLATRYLLIPFPECETLKLLNKDLSTAMSYFGTAAISWFVTKHFERAS